MGIDLHWIKGNFLHMRYLRNIRKEICSRTAQNISAPDPVRKRKRMVQNLKDAGIVNKAVLLAMEFVPRHLFVPDDWKPHAYENMALPIGYGQTISHPLVVARMLEYLNPAKGMRVLEIGTGSGYQTALLSAMGCIVYGMERLRDLFRKSQIFFQSSGYRNIYLHCSDGTLGLPEAAPYDRIIVAAGGPDIPPPLIAQLEVGGIMIIPAGKNQRTQRLWQVEKQQDRVIKCDLGSASFVELIGDHGWER